MTAAKRVGAYMRVSTMNQVIEHDSSLDTQRERIRQRIEYEAKQANAKGQPVWQLAEEYREEGRSGKNIDRPALQRLLADVKAGKLDIVCVTKLDRITRSLLDFYSLWETFEKHDVEFIALDDSFDTSGATGRAMLKIALVFAELERERTSERTKEKVETRRLGGMWFGGQLPFGYVPHPTNSSTLDVDPVAAEIVRKEIFERFLETPSVRALTKYLLRHKIGRAERESRRGKRVGGAFTVQGVLHILSNPAYVAKRRLEDGSTVACNWPAIITDELFERVQARLERNRTTRPTNKSSKHTFLLQSLVRCGKCGAKMLHASGTGRTETHFYYRCGTKKRSAGESCDTRDVPAEQLENFVLDQLAHYVVDKQVLAAAVRQANAGRDDQLRRIQDELAKVKAAHQRVQTSMANLLDAIEDGQKSDQILARLKTKEAEECELRNEAAALRVREQAIEQQVLDAESVADGYSRFATLFTEARRLGAMDELKGLLAAVIDGIEWKPSPTDPKAGEALLELLELPSELWEQDRDAVTVNHQGSGSFSCKDWLRLLDSNQRPGD